MELLKNPDIVALFDYGSVVYGTNTTQSDKDFIAIIKDNIEKKDYSSSGVDITTYSVSEFQKLVHEHEISALECLFLDQKHIHKKEIEFDFQLDKVALRNAISSKSSNSWVKAKKKFIVEKDFNPYIGQKSAWHAIRMLEFGTQLGKNGSISDYSSMNHIYKDILACSSWEDLDKNFRTLYNQTASEFRLVAPKEVNLQSKPLKP